MSEKYKAYNPEATYFVTLTIIDWVDLLTRPVYKHVVVDSLNYCSEKKGLLVFGYVLMSNHIHLLVTSKGNSSIGEIIRDFKRHTTKQFINLIEESSIESRKEWLLAKFSFAAKRLKRNMSYKVWQDGFHPIEESDNDILEQKLDYIHDNPVRAEIVVNQHDYKYSSARDYVGFPSEVRVACI